MPAWQGWSYEDFVRAGQEVQSRSNWMLGDLAAAVETSYGEGTLTSYAADIGVEYTTLMQFRRVAIAYPSKSRPMGDFSWTVYRDLANQPDRLELLASGTQWNVVKVRELVASRQPEKREPPPPPGR